MISFIIPTLPNEPYLSKTLESIADEIERSGCKDFEILVMVKKEGYLPIFLKDFEEKHGYAKCYPIEGNRSVARNEGIRMARNNILSFVDGDTEIERDFIKNTLKAFENGYGYVNYSARPLKYEDKKRFYYYLKLMNFFQWLFTNMNICRPYGFCMSIRKDICEEVKVNEEAFLSLLAGHGEDSEFGRRYESYCEENGIRGMYEAKSKAHTSMREWYKNGFWGMTKRVILNNLIVPYSKKPLIKS